MRVLILVLGLICAACAVPRQSRIVGGESTSIENYPFMAAMLRRSWVGEFSQSCGGSLISPSAVVSAAQCFSGGPDTLRVRLGSSYSSSGGAVHIVSRIIIHPQFNRQLIRNDVAVVKLSVPAVLSDQIRAARIAGAPYMSVLPENAGVHAVGWGDKEFEGRPTDILQHVAVNVINHQVCIDRYAYLKTLPGMSNLPDVTPEMLCFGILDVGGKDACQGDAGAPVIHARNVLIGITSWGHECAHPMYPSVGVRVSSYYYWIYSNSV